MCTYSTLLSIRVAQLQDCLVHTLDDLSMVLVASLAVMHSSRFWRTKKLIRVNVSILINLRSCFNLMTADYLTTTLKQFGSRVTASCPTIMRYVR